MLARLHDQHLVRVFDLNFDETTGTPIDEVSAAFGVTPDIIYKVKNRVNKMIEAVEMEYAE